MNATNIVKLPIVMTPSRRIMRREGTTHDRAYRGPVVTHVELNPGETSTAWTPKLLPLFTFPFAAPSNVEPVQAGNAMAIVRDGYEGAPLGVVTDFYKPVDHRETVADITESTQGKATLEGALIDGHGYHVIHSFRLDTLSTEMVNGVPLVSRLTLVHDHTGMGSVRASVVTYIGADIVCGSRNYSRKIHTGTGSKDVGVGSRGNWLGVIDAMLETASLQQAALGNLLRKAAATAVTEEHVARFNAAGIQVEREKSTRDDDGKEVLGAIKAATLLDVLAAHHKAARGSLKWGVWSRRLEGAALACLEEICGIDLPRQLFRKGAP